MEYTVSRNEYGFVEKALNFGASCLIQSGLKVGHLETQSILRAAQRQTGLTNWGSEDFIGRLDKLTEFSQAAPITSLARVFARQTFIKAVGNRLKMHAPWSDTPKSVTIQSKSPSSSSDSPGQERPYSRTYSRLRTGGVP